MKSKLASLDHALLNYGQLGCVGSRSGDTVNKAIAFLHTYVRNRIIIVLRFPETNEKTPKFQQSAIVLWSLIIPLHSIYKEPFV